MISQQVKQCILTYAHKEGRQVRFVYALNKASENSAGEIPASESSLQNKQLQNVSCNFSHAQ